MLNEIVSHDYDYNVLCEVFTGVHLCTSIYAFANSVSPRKRQTDGRHISYKHSDLRLDILSMFSELYLSPKLLYCIP